MNPTASTTRIAMVTPGAGGMICGSCLSDNALAEVVIATHEVLEVFLRAGDAGGLRCGEHGESGRFSDVKMTRKRAEVRISEFDAGLSPMQSHRLNQLAGIAPADQWLRRREWDSSTAN